MAKYSWGDAASRIARQKREQEATAQVASEQEAGSLAAAKKQREEIFREIIQPLLRAMAKYGNPGSIPHRQRRRVRTWAGYQSYYICTDGEWQFNCQHSPNTPMADAVVVSSFADGKALLEDHCARRLQDELVRLMQKHGVPIPRD